jgi:preprotein translocase subunit YajC
MDFFIASAYAQDASPQGGLLSFLPLIVIFVVFYFLLIRPQMKRAKEHKALISQLAVGDEVVSSGGLLGKVTQVGDSFVTLELADNVKVKLQKHDGCNRHAQGHHQVSLSIQAR